MADQWVTCRHCGIGINYRCDCDDDAAEERGREEVWGEVLDTLRIVYGRDMPYNEGPCELIADLVPPDTHADVSEAAAEALSVLTDLAESAAYWSEYDVPLGIVSRVDFAKARLAAALAAKGGDE